MKFYGELLVFALLLITNLRVFFVQHVRRDPLVVLAPFTFVISVLQILAWGIDLFTVLGVFIALLVLLSNFHAIFRYSERLYIDHYSPLMKVWAILTITVSAAALAAAIYFAPVEQNIKKLGISEKQYLYKGSFRSGFEEAGPFAAHSLTLFEFTTDDSGTAGTTQTIGISSPAAENQDLTNQNLIVLFVPDKRGDTNHYKPYLEQLALRGITVYSADFFADDGQWLHSIGDKKILRRVVMVIQSVLNEKSFNAQREYYSYNITQEYSVLLPLLRERCGANKKFFLITDFMADIAAEDLQKKNPEDIAGVLKLSSIEEYKTSGYGCIEQTDPLLALSLGFTRDKTLAIPKLLAAHTVTAINEVQK